MYKKVVFLFFTSLVVLILATSFIWNNFKLDTKIKKLNQRVKELSNIPTINLSKPNQIDKDTIDQSLWNPPNEVSKKWYNALGALVQYTNYERHELKSTIPQVKITGLLKNEWGVTDRQKAIQRLDFLLTSGDRLVFDQMVDTLEDVNSKSNNDFSKAKKDYLGETNQKDPVYNFYVDQIWQNRGLAHNQSLWAWDIMRLVNLARWSYSVGYISEEEAWRYIVPAGKKLQTKFTSWESATNNYLIGRSFSMWATNPSYLNENVNILLSSPTSPWVTIDWNTKLN